jgi:hypothetical protein
VVVGVLLASLLDLFLCYSTVPVSSSAGVGYFLLSRIGIVLYLIFSPSQFTKPPKLGLPLKL